METDQKGGGCMFAAASCCSMTSSGAFSMDTASPILEVLWNRVSCETFVELRLEVLP